MIYTDSTQAYTGFTQTSQKPVYSLEVAIGAALELSKIRFTQTTQTFSNILLHRRDTLLYCIELYKGVCVFNYKDTRQKPVYLCKRRAHLTSAK